MSMKQTVSALINTQLREKEIGMLTSLNPKNPEKDPDPQLGQDPPKPGRSMGARRSDPQLNPGQRGGSIKQILKELERKWKKKKQTKGGKPQPKKAPAGGVQKKK